MVLSENLHPIAIKQSQSVTALFVDSSPCIPRCPSESSWSSDIDPFPINVVAIGMFVSVANFTNSSDAFDSITPPPAIMTGFLLSTIVSIARFICLVLPVVVGLYPGRSNTFFISSCDTSSSSTSLGKSTTTTPGLPVDAISYAASITFGRSHDFLGWKFSLVIGIVNPIVSTS